MSQPRTPTRSLRPSASYDEARRSLREPVIESRDSRRSSKIGDAPKLRRGMLDPACLSLYLLAWLSFIATSQSFGDETVTIERLRLARGGIIETNTPKIRHATARSLGTRPVTVERLGIAGGRVIESSRLESRRSSQIDEPDAPKLRRVKFEKDMSFEKERLAFAREKLAVEVERIQLERERLAFDRKKLKADEENVRVTHLIELLKLKKSAWPWFDLQRINEELDGASIRS
ncbi:hypothetical protein FB451DRAFT_100842 [Mycena latifolia]|nr:hypothetical protein FB451DRAFT_100842 [Mycena latifolia]